MLKMWKNLFKKLKDNKNWKKITFERDKTLNKFYMCFEKYILDSQSPEECYEKKRNILKNKK